MENKYCVVVSKDIDQREVVGERAFFSNKTKALEYSRQIAVQNNENYIYIRVLESPLAFDRSNFYAQYIRFYPHPNGKKHQIQIYSSGLGWFRY